jgi:hypothetical protein
MLLWLKRGDAHERLDSALHAMIGDSDAERARAVARYARSGQANRHGHSAGTLAEIEADAVFKAARPLLNRRPLRNRKGFSTEPTSRPAWAAIARHLKPQFPGLAANRLRMICRKRM